MNEGQRPPIFQLELVCAICAELDRQRPGALIHQDLMNAIIQAADDLVLAARQGLSWLEEPAEKKS